MARSRYSPLSSSSLLRRMKKRFRLIPFLTFFLVKALCSLVVLNLYMGSQISIVQLEDSFSLMMHRDRDSRKASAGGGDVGGSDNNLFAKGRGVRTESNSTFTSHESIGNNGLMLNQTQHGVDKVGMIVPDLSDGTLQGKERLWHILQTRNVTQVDAEYWASIPTWDTILGNIQHRAKVGKGGDVGDASPIIHGLETCEAFRNATSSDPSQRRLAPAGLFNTGTNYLSVLLEYNCQNPDRVKKYHGNVRRGHGNEWEVPWGKHSPASSRGRYFKNPNLKYTVDDVLPVVLVRNPHGWMKSMCRNPYTAKWKGVHDKKTCPRLKETKTEGGGDAYNPVDVAYGAGKTHHQSLGHLWNDWYGEYFYGNGTGTSGGKRTDAPFPRLIIRFEDIIFFPYEVTKQVCECSGGVLGHRQDDEDVADGTFHYVVRSAKAGMGHGPAGQRNGLIDSWARYGSGDPKDAYSEEEVEIAREVLDPLIMDAFGYNS